MQYAEVRERARTLAAEGRLNLSDIAREVGVSRQCVSNWLTPQERARLPVYKGPYRPRPPLRWTPEAVAELAEKAARMTREELAEAYGQAFEGLRAVMVANDIPVPTPTPKPKQKRKISDDDIALVDMWNKAGVFVRDIAAEYGTTEESLYQRLFYWRRANGVSGVRSTRRKDEQIAE
jgi:transposase-like protein